MRSYIKEGWGTVKNHFYIVIILFLYQLLWGFFLYRFIDSIVVPILQRYPDPQPTEMSLQLFLIESQFQLTKTNLIYEYVWMIVGLFAIRMFITPFINAGLFYSISQRDDRGILFFKGIKYAWKPVFLFYWFETLLVFTPAYWIVPYINEQFNAQPLEQLLYSVVPILLGWMVLAWIIHQVFLYIQFGYISKKGVFRSAALTFRRFPTILGVFAILFILLLFIGGLFTTASLIWTGLLALILQQSYHLIRTIFKVWMIASQYQIWHRYMSE